MQPIPYFDLTRQFSNYRDRWLEQIDRIGRSGNFILGEAITQVESNLAETLQVKHAITVSSGTDAIVLALRAAGVGQGDSVIVPNFTFYASAEAISLTGAQPKFVDIAIEDFNIDPDQINAAIDKTVKAILPVHLFGLPARMPEICAIAKQHNIAVIEDVAQAFGSQCHGSYTGSIGDMGCFSFYPTKILGAYGDGGMITTDDDTLAHQLRLIRNHGTTGPNQHELIGCTSRLNCVQAVLLGLKLEPIHQVIDRRRQLAKLYVERLQECDVILPRDLPDKSHVYNIFTIRTKFRNKIAAALQANQVGYQIYYPKPVHQQLPYQGLGYEDNDFPVAMQVCGEVISLPLYPEMPDNHVDRICEIIRGSLA